MTRFTPALLLLAACAAAPVARTPDDAADQLRDRLARDPGDPRRATILEQLAQVELERARRSNTVLAYRRFLAEFPAGDEAVTAKALLEGLRFEEAQRTRSAAGWEAFLSEHPRGKHEVEARNALGAIEIAAALGSEDLALVRQTLARYPDHPDRPPLVTREDDLAWAAAANAGTQAISDYLASHPNGAHRLQANHQQETNLLNEIREAEDLPQALALSSRADANESHRALVAGLQLDAALRQLDLPGLKRLAGLPSSEPSVAAIAARAKAAVDAFAARPLSAEQQATVAAAAPGAGLRARDVLTSALQSGDPVLRVAAVRELAEWAHLDDLKIFLTVALQSEYVGVRLAAVEAVRTLAASLKPEVWRSIRRTREDDLLGKELTAFIWRQVAALREADGRSADAMTAWRAVLGQDSSDLAARARLFALSQQGTDRIATGATARELLREVTDFAENRWPAPRPSREEPQGKGRVIGVTGELTILRQLCTALELGDGAVQALGALGRNAAPQEQQLLNLARADGEQALNRIRTRRTELEKSIRAEDASFPPCESDPSAAPIQASRRARIEAIRKLGRSGDARLIPFVEGLARTPGSELRATATEAAAQLRREGGGVSARTGP